MAKSSGSEQTRIIPKKLESTQKIGLRAFVFAILHVAVFIGDQVTSKQMI